MHNTLVTRSFQVVRVSPAGCTVEEDSDTAKWHARIDSMMKSMEFEKTGIVRHGALMQVVLQVLSYIPCLSTLYTAGLVLESLNAEDS